MHKHQTHKINTQGPDKLNNRHLKHIGPPVLGFLTSMFETTLNHNIIPHTWKLANIVPIPKPNKDIDKGTSCRPIFLLSVIEKNIAEEPSSLHNSKHTKYIYATRVQNTTLYNHGTTHIKQHRRKAVHPNGSPCADNHCSTRYDQNVRHNQHTHLIRKLLQTRILCTIIKFITNDI